MRIVFLGLPLAALLLNVDGHEVVLAGVRRGLEQGVRRLRRQLGDPRVVLDPQRDWSSFRNLAEQSKADLLVSWFFTRRIPMDLVNACRLGGVGVHPSLLPRHRGPDPFFGAIDAGDEETGVTVHRIGEAYDTGAILLQRRLPIEHRWNAWHLARALDRPSLEALREVVRRMAAGEVLAEVEQDEQNATSAPFPSEEDRVLQWDQPSERIARRVRALAPNPGALVDSGEVCLVVIRVEVRFDAPKVLLPGEAAIVGGITVVRTRDGGVALLRAEVDGTTLDAAAIAQQIARDSGK